MQPVIQLELKAIFQDKQVGISKQRRKIQAKLPSLDQKSIATARQFQGGAENAESSTSNVPTHLTRRKLSGLSSHVFFRKLAAGKPSQTCCSKDGSRNGTVGKNCSKT
jgi:hypothetical protein